MRETTSDEPSTSANRQTTYDSERETSKENHFVILKRNNNKTTNPTLNQQETSDETESELRLLSVYCRAGKLGAAYYTLQSGELFMLEEIVDRPPEYLMFSSLYHQVEPAHLILDGKNQSAFIQLVKKTVFDSDANDEGRCRLVFLSIRDYSFEACKRRIHSLSLPHEPPNCTEEERTLFLRTLIDFSQTQSVHALGTLLRYLDMHWSSLDLGLETKPDYLCLKIISLNDIVTIDGDTHRGLQIFNTVAHPSNFKKGVQGSSKERLSLYQLFSKCSSKVGHSRMRVFMQHPTTDLAKLKLRQDVVAFFLKSQNESTMRNICSSLRFIKNINGLMVKIKALSATVYQWKSLYDTLCKAVLISEICGNVGQGCEFIEELGNTDVHKLYEMALYMNKIIDFELSKSEGKFTVKAGVDPELDRKKQSKASLLGLMSETAKVELERLPPFIEECMMVYMPHLGYLLGVKVWAPNLTMEQKELPNMKFMFQNDDYIHYKSKGCEELDVMIGDTYPEIVAHETRIMMRLTAILLDNLQTLAALIDKCAELDCLITISKVCKEFNYVRPTLTEDKIISIKQGRHPLHILTCDNFVPNDTESSRETGHVKILIGPNASGKSVYMKQTGLIIYLAHIGSFVPAERATIGIISSIHTRMHSTECVAAHMSAFLIDLRQMSIALQESSPNSLIIIDEFGKGTSEKDGFALLAACLNTLLFREDSPHVFLSTHFLNIKEFIVDSPIVKFLKFEYVMEDGEPVFLFRVCEGSVNCSFAIPVATANGIPKRITDRAEQVMDCVMNKKLPPPNKRIIAKLQSCIETMKVTLLTDNI